MPNSPRPAATDLDIEDTAAAAAADEPPSRALGEIYARESTRMAHVAVYKTCPALWRLAGAGYRELDLWAGILFVVGALGFFLVPLFRVYNPESAYALNIALSISVLIFLLAKFLLAVRAIYAALWKRPHKRPCRLYHAAVWVLIAAGIVFLLVPLGEIASWAPQATGMLSCVSGYLFLLGTSIFAVDGYLLLKPGLFSNIENQYFWGSFMLVIGSILFVFAGMCDSPVGRTYPASDEAEYKQGSVCSAEVVQWLNSLGGLAFVVGSIEFLIFAVVEYREMHNGPDPRFVAHHGQEEPHPYHHQPSHLDGGGGSGGGGE